MLPPFKNCTPWQDNGSFHIQNKVHANKVPIKIKRRTPPANPRTKNKAAGNKGYTETKFIRNMLTFTIDILILTFSWKS